MIASFIKIEDVQTYLNQFSKEPDVEQESNWLFDDEKIIYKWKKRYLR